MLSLKKAEEHRARNTSCDDVAVLVLVVRPPVFF